MTPSRSQLISRLVLESAVIIASILAAFAVDTWWDGRKERREELLALEAMRTEFSAARENIVFYRSLQGRILQSVASLQDSLGAATARGEATVVVPDTALAWAYIPPTTSVDLPTREGLVASGRLGVIRNPALRAALGSWGSALAELQEEEEDSRALAYGDMDRALRARMNTDGLWRTANLLFSDSLDAEHQLRARILPVDTEVLGVFHLRESLLLHTLSEFEPLLGQVDTILELIEESLGPARG